MEVDLAQAFAVFGEQDSACRSYCVAVEGARLFVKVATTAVAAESLRRAITFHRSVTHPVIVAPIHMQDRGDDDVRLV